MMEEDRESEAEDLMRQALADLQVEEGADDGSTSPTAATSPTTTSATPASDGAPASPSGHVSAVSTAVQGMRGQAPQPTRNPAALVSGRSHPRDDRNDGAMQEGNNVIMFQKAIKAKQVFYVVTWNAPDAEAGDYIALMERENPEPQWKLCIEGRPKGTTHIPQPLVLAEYHVTHSRADGTPLSQTPYFKVGPNIAMEAILRPEARQVEVQWSMTDGEPTSWDWIGMFNESEADPQQYIESCYVSLTCNFVNFQAPTRPGRYKYVYFSGHRKYFALDRSNTIVVPDLNKFEATPTTLLPGQDVMWTLEVNQVPRKRSDWIGLYKLHERRQANYVTFWSVPETGQTKVKLPNNLEPGLYNFRYISYALATLAGDMLTYSNPIKVEAVPAYVSQPGASSASVDAEPVTPGASPAPVPMEAIGSQAGVPGSPMGALPPVMTPAQAAAVVQVAESDILDAIRQGELKAKQIGSTYRITANNLQAYLDA